MTRNKVNGFEAVSFVKLPGGDYVIACAEMSVPIGGRHLQHMGYDLHYVVDHKTLKGPMSRWGPAVMSCKATDAESKRKLLESAVTALKLGSFPVKPVVSMERKPILHNPAHFFEEVGSDNVPAPRGVGHQADFRASGGPTYDEILRTNDVEAAIQMMSEIRLRPASDWQETFRMQDGLSRVIGNRNPIPLRDSISQLEAPQDRAEPTAPNPVNPARVQQIVGQEQQRRRESVSSLPPYTEQLPRGEARINVGPDIEVAQAIGEPVNRRPEPVDRGSNPGRRAAPASVAGSVQSSRSSTVSVSRSLIANLVARGGPNGLSARDRASLRESLRTDGGSPIGPALERIHEDPRQADSGRPSAYRSVDSSGSFMF